MRAYKADTTSSARRDLASIRDWIIDEYDDPIGADKVVYGIIDKINRLRYFPKASAVRVVSGGKPIRVTRAGKYEILFYVDDADVVVKVIAIVHSRRDFEGILRARDLG